MADRSTNLSSIRLEELASSFDDKGFELFLEKRVHRELSVEETITASLIMPEARLIEGVPILLTKNKINYGKLKELIDKYELWNEFGYLGNFALKHIDNNELKELVGYCHNKLKPHAKLSLLDDAFFRHSKTKEQEEWSVIGAPPYSALEEKYKLYCR